MLVMEAFNVPWPDPFPLPTSVVFHQRSHWLLPVVEVPLSCISFIHPGLVASL